MFILATTKTPFPSVHVVFGKSESEPESGTSEIFKRSSAVPSMKYTFKRFVLVICLCFQIFSQRAPLLNLTQNILIASQMAELTKLPGSQQNSQAHP